MRKYLSECKKSSVIVYLAVGILILASSTSLLALSGLSQGELLQKVSNLPLTFTENHGQWNSDVLYNAVAGNTTIWFTNNGITYSFSRAQEDPSILGASGSPLPLNKAGMPDKSLLYNRFAQGKMKYEQMMIGTEFVGTNQNVTVTGQGKMGQVSNYFRGNDQSKWITGVPNYSSVVYHDIYKGIDLKYYGNGRQTEYDFVVSPGSDPSQIKLKYDGVKTLGLSAFGELVVSTKWGEVTELQPKVYQVVNGEKKAISAEYQLKGDNSFGFKLKGGYDSRLPVVIDPILNYGSYLGGRSGDKGFAVGVHGDFIYVAGMTNSADFLPSRNFFDSTYNGTTDNDVFITGLIVHADSVVFTDYAGQRVGADSVVFTDYLGGDGDDIAYGMVLDDDGNFYVAGGTTSDNFPMVNAYDATYHRSRDGFLSKIRPDGKALLYSTYFGGSKDENFNSLTLTPDHDVVLVGTTLSNDLPTVSPYDASFNGGGDGDIFVARFNSNFALTYCTYLGGTDSDYGNDITSDGLGNYYICGETKSTDFPTQNAVTSSAPGGGKDAYIAKFSGADNSLLYSTYFGGRGWDQAYGIAAGELGEAYVTGWTDSDNLPTTQNAYAGSRNGDTYDIFVVKLSGTGNQIDYCTYIGGTGVDGGEDIVVDPNGDAYLTGTTQSSNYPVANAVDPSFNQGLIDIVLTVLSPDGTSLLYSTYFGGNDEDFANAITLDSKGAVYIAGYTYSDQLPMAVTPPDSFITGRRVVKVDTLINGNDTTKDTTFADTYGPKTVLQNKLNAGPDAFVLKYSGELTPGSPTSVSQIYDAVIPNKPVLNQNYPNPFNPSTDIRFSILKTANVKLAVFNILGQKIKTVVDERLAPGTYQTVWDGKDASGNTLASGIYFYRIQAGDFAETRKMLLMK
jgi:hypothetical protein